MIKTTVTSRDKYKPGDTFIARWVFDIEENDMVERSKPINLTIVGSCTYEEYMGERPYLNRELYSKQLAALQQRYFYKVEPFEEMEN